jgi:hypothetical protein
MLEAGPISLVDLFTPVDRFSLFASLSYPHSLQQTFTSTRPASAEAYKQDLADFLKILATRKAWLTEDAVKKLIHYSIKGLSLSITEYIAAPASGSLPSQFCLVTAFSNAQCAADYRKHFYP